MKRLSMLAWAKGSGDDAVTGTLISWLLSLLGAFQHNFKKANSFKCASMAEDTGMPVLVW
jgi:hypothetical protein